MQRIIIYFLCLFCLMGNTAPMEELRLFNSHETMSSDLAPFKKWNGVRDTLFDTPEDIEYKKCTEKDTHPACQMQRWQAFLKTITPPVTLDDLRAVNQYLNTHRYIIDPINWGLPDYWAIPYQFLMKDGDCEDYAIAKYASLRQLGVSTEDMRIVIVQDNNLDAIHAVLAVRFGKTTYILDNQIEQVLPDNAILHYIPIYSINEHAWWRHQMP